ncbi:PQQ-binding-like beta-propeller repeat protein [Isoptericola dokdonensis]|uniref:PQQ enzyme repeat protein n=1 Tax=Isoptericola dokdonensis DS-3 TaxID=1300344 RepID=A0A168FP20_9MICO|nr:PQQ-binding-like beta-propeller repeat protein [Isoptericola dokdonensis]ANC32229.1 PQQ enzyme repeat protein [Isoptericola dokdonensis DS-3]
MARRRDTGTVSFDVSFDADDTLDPGVPSPRRRTGGRWRAATPRQRRRAGLIGGGLVVLVVGGLATTTAVSAHADAQRLREAPGGVLSLEGPLVESVRTDADDLAAVLDAGVLALVDGADVVAWDVAAGEEVWRTEVGGSPRCGPRPQLGGAVDFATPVDTITCLQDDGARVTVLTADGDVTGTRDLPADGYGREHQVVAPAAEGGLLVVEHDPGLPERVEIPADDSGDPWLVLDELERQVTQGTAHVEDALTGDVRFELPVSQPGGRGAGYCYDTYLTNDASVGGESEATLRPADVVATPHLVMYERCGASARGTAAGAPLDVGEGIDSYGSIGWFVGPGASSVQTATDGELVVPDGSTTKVVDASGDVVLRAPAQLAAPSATDGSPAGLWIGTRDYAYLVALDETGEQVWQTDGGDISLLAQTADTVVMANWERVVGRDPADGAERWRVPLMGTDLLGGAVSRDWNPRAMVTDGLRVMVLVESYSEDGSGSFGLLTVDLASGDHEIDMLDLDGRDGIADGGERGWVLPWLVAVDGHPALLGIGLDEAYRYSVTSVATLGSP